MGCYVLPGVSVWITLGSLWVAVGCYGDLWVIIDF